MYEVNDMSSSTKAIVNGSLCPCGGNATIEQQIGTPIVRSFIAISPKHVLVSHRAHRLIVNVQPSFTTATAAAPSATVPVRVEHVEGVVPATSGRTVMVEHAVE